MGIERSDKIKAALFLIVTVVLFTGLVLGLIGVEWMKPKELYYVDFVFPVKGLNSGSIVRQNGMPIGKVKRFGKPESDLRCTRVTIEVERDTAIYADSVATLELESLIVGNRGINISLGSSRERRLIPTLQASNNIIRGVQSDFDVMAGTMVEIARMTTGLIQNINTVFTLENAAALAAMLSEINQFMVTNNALLPTTLGKFNTIIDSTQAKVEQFDVEELQQEFHATMAMLKEAIQTANNTMVQNQRTISDTLNNVRGVTDALRELIERLNRQPGVLVRGAREREKEWSDE